MGYQPRIDQVPVGVFPRATSRGGIENSPFGRFGARVPGNVGSDGGVITIDKIATQEEQNRCKAIGVFSTGEFDYGRKIESSCRKKD
jgi:hypothetical protein